MTALTRHRPEPAPGGVFHHPALFYGTDEEYLAGVGGFIGEGAADGAPLLVAVPGPRLDLLRDTYRAQEGITWVDMRDAGRNPGRILSMLQEFADRAGDRAPAIVGEPIWVGRTPAETREATRHEALINLAFAHRHATILCPYDTALPGDVLTQARRTHPVVGDADAYRPSPEHTDAHEVARDCDTPLPEPDDPIVMPYGTEDLARVRDTTDQWAEAAGMSAQRRTDLLLAVTEATSNSVRHGGGRGTLRLWRTADALVAETSDGGRFTDPLVGRRRPDPFSPHGGRGVWMMHQLADLVEIRASAQGLVLRLHMAV
ncbi:sensor histidine kinase [Streptomyces thermolilacinus]|uniref:Regulator n=1 Tax=Streptomyces thermolilacinus SPC6 TaxID=1306406 RepID=A0A1D3DZB5_9ACTN|nr:sensor histidine kinase [Streptomyces thermolilacinus]OEJ97673.1 regulator [Streptomyces thermolilacinus SPC6]